MGYHAIKKSDNAETSLWSPSKGPQGGKVQDLDVSSSKTSVSTVIEPRQKATRRLDPGQDDSSAVVSASLAVGSTNKSSPKDEGKEILRPGTVDDIDPKSED